MADTEESITRVLEAYASAVLAKDVEAFMALYRPGVRVFDAWGVWSYEGSAAWRNAVAEWFRSLGGDSVEVTFDDVHTRVAGGLGSVSAIVTYAAVSARGERLRQMQNRLTWILDTTAHVPGIVHEHTSAPIGFEDSKAMLERARAP